MTVDQQTNTPTAADFVLLRTDGTTTYGRRDAGEELRTALRRHIPDLSSQGAGRLRMWFNDSFTAAMASNQLANTVIGALGYSHPTGWRGTVALTMEEDFAGEYAPLLPQVREAVDELVVREGRR